MTPENETLAMFQVAMQKEIAKEENGITERFSSPDQLGVARTAYMDSGIVNLNNVAAGLLPGQEIGGFGTTIYQPKRSDPTIERIFGEKRYTEKPQESFDSTKVKIEYLENKVDVLMKMLANKVADKPLDTPVDESKAEAINEMFDTTKPEKTKSDLFKEQVNQMTYQELIELAKNLPVKLERGMKKEDLLNAILDTQNKG